jgi:NifB/MoaA-like Fe-S oxidoreductase
MYLKAGLDIPPPEYYEDFSQIENGVGMIASMLEEFEYAFEDLDESPVLPRRVSIATGNAAYPFISSLALKLENRFDGLTVNVYNINNNFFGENITVAGLITGIDLSEQLKAKDLGSTLFIPRVMLESECKMFLDSMELQEVCEKLNTEISVVPNDGEIFLRKILGLDA